MKTLKTIFAVFAAVAILPAIADLPSGYRQLDYVETDGKGWVNTLFRPTCTNAVEMKAAITDLSDTAFLYCSRRIAGNRAHALCVYDGKARFDYQTGSESLYTFADANPHVFFAAPSEDAGQDGVSETSKKWTLNVYVDETSVGSVSGAYFTPDGSAYFCLFGAYGGTTGVLNDETSVSNLASCRFYYFKVWDTKEKGSLLCHIVPVYGEVEQAIGLYDLVAGQFLSVHGNAFAASCALASDEDWSDDANAVGSGVTVDLAGNDLSFGAVATNTSSAFAGSAYQDLAYIVASGAQALQITDCKLPGDARVEMKIRPTAISAVHWLFCSRTGAKNNAYCALITSEGKLRFDFNKGQTSSDATLSAGSDYELVFDGTTAQPTWFVNDSQEAAHEATSNDFTGGSDLVLFGSGLAGTFSGRLYYFTVRVDGDVALDLRPVRRISDGAVGLYDKEGNTFYPSQTATAFPAIGVTPEFANSSETASELRVVSREHIPGYTLVDRITGSEAFIKTGYVPAATDRLELKASLSDVSGTYGLFCSRKSNTSEMFAALLTGSNVRCDFNSGSGEQKATAFEPEANEVFTVAIDGGVKACYTNGAVAATFTSNDFTPSATVYLFALHTADGSSSSRAKGDIYYFKARGADGKLKACMVPAVRNSDGAAGLYDLVRREFFAAANAGSGINFTALSTMGDGKLYADTDGAFTATEIAANVTLVKDGEGAFDGGGSTLAGTLVPGGGTVGGLTLQNGATLDLSAASDAFSLDGNAISFADAAKIYVNAGSRKLTKNTPLVSWTSAPSNIAALTFRLVAGGEEMSMLVKPDGLYPAPRGLVISIH